MVGATGQERRLSLGLETWKGGDLLNMHQLLVIDADADARQRIHGILTAYGHSVSLAMDERQGLQIARAQQPDLILCGLPLEDGSGARFLSALAESPSTAAIPVVFLAKTENRALLRRAQEWGADGLVEYPCGESSLMAVVNARLKRLEQVRLHSNGLHSKLLTVIDASPNLVGVLDPSYTQVFFLNQTGRALLGLPLAEDSGPLTTEQLHPPEVLAHLRTVVLPAAEQNGRWQVEADFRVQEGSVIPFSLIMLVQRSAGDGPVDCVAVVARDIRAEREARREQNLLEVQLRQAQKLESIGQLAAGIAHEINTPTQYIGDNLHFLQTAFQDISRLLFRYQELIRDTQKNYPAAALATHVAEAQQAADLDFLMTEAPKAVQQSLDGVERVAKIVRSMKDFSHPGPSTKTLTDLNRAIDSTLTVARHEWKYVAEMQTDFDRTLPLVPCLPGEFNQVILNLVINAAHAIADRVGDGGRGKGTITITTRKLAEVAEIQVSDTGVGIPEKIRDKIFEPFFTTKPVGKGTGQGLAIARSVIIDKHGGTIEFVSTPGQGTTFIVRLPLMANQVKPERNE